MGGYGMAAATTDAPIISNRRRSRCPIFEVLPSRSLPPVECRRGVRPIQAARSLRNGPVRVRAFAGKPPILRRAVRVKHVLGQVQPDDANNFFHGRPLVAVSTPLPWHIRCRRGRPPQRLWDEPRLQWTVCHESINRPHCASAAHKHIAHFVCSTARGFVQEPCSAFGLINPVLDQARSCDVSTLVAQRVRRAQESSRKCVPDMCQ